MAEEQEPQQVPVVPDDPQYQLEEHVAFKRRQECVNAQLQRLIKSGLSEFRPIMDGTSYAWTKLSLNNKGITMVSEVIAEYPHLRRLQMSSNAIADTIHIQKLEFLTHVDLSRNAIAEARFLSNPNCFPYVKSLNLSNNKLKALPPVSLRNLETINFNGNNIASCEDFEGHHKLQVMELRSNKITALDGLKKAVALKALFLADNNITSLRGLSELPKLEKLHVRKNKIADLSDCPELESLRELNLRENQVSKLDQLRGAVNKVKIINLLANPVSDELGDNTKKEVWMRFRNYEKINKSQMTGQEREEFDKEHKERIAEQQRVARQEEEARLQAEREAAEAAAQKQ